MTSQYNTQNPVRLLLILVSLLCALPLWSAPGTHTMLIASLMYEPVKWDKDANSQQLEKLIRAAAARGAELIVTPEGALEGYVVNEVVYASGEEKQELTKRFQELAEPLECDYVRHFQNVTRELGVWLVFCFLEADEGKTYNTAVLIRPDGTMAGRYRKTHFAQGYSTGAEYKDNPVGYTRGSEYPVFDMDGLKVGLMICYDRQVPLVARQLSENGAELIINPSFGIRGSRNRKLISERTQENGIPVIFVHPRQTVVGDASGEITADLRPTEDSVQVLEVSLKMRRRAQPIE